MLKYLGITWYEALAYTRWLTARWRGKVIGPDQEVALPSEPEWEKAARGGLEIIQADSPHARLRPARSGLPALDVSKDRLAPNAQAERRYPWGPDPDPNRANYADTGIGATSAVGIFPHGASPYGCEEMSGNCLEWTRSLWGKDMWKPSFPYPYDPADGREEVHADREVLRVLRGGGFGVGAPHVRCAFRFRYSPDHHGFGFRVVVRPLL